MSWGKVTLGQFITVRNERFKPKDVSIAGLKRIDKIDFSGKIFISEKPSNTDMILIKKGDLVISGINVEKGAMAIYTGNEDITATIHYSSYSFDENKIDIDFLKHFLKSLEFKEALKEQVPGGIKTEIKPKHLLPLLVNIPIDIKDQRAVVKILQQRNSKVDAISLEILKQLAFVKKLRQKLLQEAIQGKLVKQNKKDEPASELLKKIKAEKEKLIAEKKLKKEKELPPIKPEEIPFDIPENWVWCRLGDLGSFRRGPFGSALTKGIFVKEGYKVYEQRNAIYDNHTLGEYFVTKEKFEELKAFRIFPKDLIVSCSGATLGRIAEIPEDAREGIMNQALMRIKLFNSTIINLYFIRLFRSPFMQKNIFSQAWGSAIPNMVGLVEIKKILIPLPPLAEQHRIFQKLDELMQYCNALEASIKQSESQNEKLLQQVLREALRPVPLNTGKEPQG